MNLEVYTPEQWHSISKAAHVLIFNKDRDPFSDRISYALVAGDELGPVGYVTCRETDSESVYWQFGGAVPDARGSVRVVRAYEAFIAYAQKRYRRITTYVHNDNVSYLHMAMRRGFRIIGTRSYKGDVFVELMKEFEEWTQ